MASGTSNGRAAACVQAGATVCVQAGLCTRAARLPTAQPACTLCSRFSGNRGFCPEWQLKQQINAVIEALEALLMALMSVSRHVLQRLWPTPATSLGCHWLGTGSLHSFHCLSQEAWQEKIWLSRNMGMHLNPWSRLCLPFGKGAPAARIKQSWEGSQDQSSERQG